MITSEQDLEKLLDNTRLSLCKYTCDNYTNKKQAFLSVYNITCEYQHDSCNFTKDLKDILPKPNCEFSDDAHVAKWEPFLVMGIICIIGNVFVMYQKFKNFLTQGFKLKEKQVYSFLILNLSAADLLMGFYLLAISIQIKNDVEGSNFFVKNHLCNTFGVINLISGQVSLTILLSISYFRLHSIVYPYQHVNTKKVILLVTLIWLIWFLFALIPVLNIKAIVEVFNFSAVYPTVYGNYQIVFNRVRKLIDELIGRGVGGTEFECLLNATKGLKNPTLLLKTLQSLGILNTGKESWSYLGVFTRQHICTVNFLPGNGSVGMFTLFLVLNNLLFCILIIVAYISIICIISGKQKTIRFLCQHTKKKDIYVVRQITNSKRNKENQKMFYRITVIIITDLITWLPICIISLIFYWHPKLPKCEYLELYSTMQTLVLCAIPLNSIVNPYIYSFQVFYEFTSKFAKKS